MSGRDLWDPVIPVEDDIELTQDELNLLTIMTYGPYGFNENVVMEHILKTREEKNNA